MPTHLLTSDDIDSIGYDSRKAPQSAISDLIAAVDENRLADPDDAIYALSLAAEISERCGDVARAVELAGRAAAIAEARDPDKAYARALHGRLLLQAGREDEGMTVLRRLRGLLITDDQAAFYLGEALEEAGRAELAMQWLTAALETTLQRYSTTAAQPDQRIADQNAVISSLAHARHRLRRELELPYDEHDRLSDRLHEISAGNLSDDDNVEGSSIMFWPRDQHAALLLRWPRLADAYGETWDGHRLHVEQTLAALSGHGEARLDVFDASVDDFANYVARRLGDPTEVATQEGYTEYRNQGNAVRQSWPPQRNNPCWCGSGQKYKKCCLPRSRT